MSSGILFMGAVTATAVQVYSPPADFVTALSIWIQSPNSLTAVLDIGFAESATSVFKSYIYRKYAMSAGASLEIKGIVMRNPQTLLIENSASQAVNVHVWGFEEESL